MNSVQVSDSGVEKSSENVSTLTAFATDLVQSRWGCGLLVGLDFNFICFELMNGSLLGIMWL